MLAVQFLRYSVECALHQFVLILFVVVGAGRSFAARF